MAASWLKIIGEKLLDTGVAYLQQVRLVRELRALQPDQARERFLAHVQELSASARAGFALTLAALANQETQADARRFIDMLRAALADPVSWKTDSGTRAKADATDRAQLRAQEETSSARASTLEEDLRRLDDWEAIQATPREEAISRYLAQLDEPQIEAFRDNMTQALENIAANIADHRRDEARIAAGRFFEDQQAYNFSRLAGAPPDPGWLATLNNYEYHQQTFEALRVRLDRLLEQRRKNARKRAAAKAESKPAARAEPRARAARAAPATPKSPRAKTSTAGAVVQALQRMLPDEVASGRVSPDRAAAYEQLLQKIAQATEASTHDGVTAAGNETRMQELIAEFMPYIADPSTLSQHATQRGRELLRHAGTLKTAVLREMADSAATLPPETAQVLGGVLDDLTRAQQEAAQASDDTALTAVEAHLLRPAARRWHEHRMTRHALLAWPQWQTNSVLHSVNRVLFAGSADLLPMLRTVAEARLLEMDAGRRLQNGGQARWDALNACHVAVFDLRRAGEITELGRHAPNRARELAGTAYELGCALALGKPVVVLASPRDVLPFDIDLTPLRIDGNDDDATALADALDDAFYVPQRETRDNAIPQAIAQLDRLTQSHPKRAQIDGMRWLDPTLERNPAAFSTAVRHILRTIEDPHAQLLRPSWPGTAADPAESRCFHVMPYRPSWAADTAAAARAACQELGFVYRLGKDGEDGCIVRGIWDDLCQASVVLVELAGGNLNVMIELGMAHALGRRIVAVQHVGEPDVRPAHIEKLRVHPYDGPASLIGILRKRLPIG